MTTVFDDFQSAPESRWAFVTDGVMGGVSSGQAQVLPSGGMRMTGQVSTENNGGFIQFRRRFEGGWPADASGMRITARGNGEVYYVFLRTTGLPRVWMSYRFAFETGSQWNETAMAFAGFTPSHPGMPPDLRPELVRSVGIVAYGRDFQADVSLRRIEIY